MDEGTAVEAEERGGRPTQDFRLLSCFILRANARESVYVLFLSAPASAS